MADSIKHQARVVGITDKVVTVLILQSSACSGCSAAKLCQSSETKEKKVDVRVQNPASYAVDDVVTLEGSISQGLQATWWAYVLPLVLLLIGMFGVHAIWHNDTITALSALLILTIYYIIMYSLRQRFEKRFSFRIVN